MAIDYNKANINDFAVSFAAKRVELETMFHYHVCNATAIASVHADTDALNSLYNALSQLHKDGMRSWFSARANTFDNGAEQDWLSWTKDNGFKIIVGRRAMRPTPEQIEKVQNDFSKSFVHKKSSTVNKDLTPWDVEIVKKAKTLAKYLQDERDKALETEGALPVPESLIRAMSDFAKFAETEVSHAKINAALPVANAA